MLPFARGYMTETTPKSMAPSSGTIDDEDNPGDERDDENEAPVRETDDRTEAPEEFEIDEELAEEDEWTPVDQDEDGGESDGDDEE